MNGSGAADRLRSAGQVPWRLMVFIAWLAICAVQLLASRGTIAALEFHDPDDELRLVQVRDLLAGQGWFDLHQYRINGFDGGVLMHWSRLVDAPIAAVILLFRPLLGTAGAEMAALLLVPALTLLAMMALIGWMASRVFDREKVLFACLVLGMTVPAMVQVLPLRIDHHGWQIVMALAAMAGFALTDQRRGGWLTGAALATWMSISFEGLPLSACFIGVLALFWLRDQRQATRLVSAIQALAGVSVLLFLATRGLADLVTHCDAISPIHLGIFVWGAACLTLIAGGKPRPLALSLGALALTAAGALAIVLLAAPQCAAGTFNEMDPVVREFWFTSVAEGLSVFHPPYSFAVQFIVPAAIGLHATIVLARRSEGELRRWWTAYALVLGAALVIGMAVSRSSAFSGALAALPLGWRLSNWLGGLKRPENPLLRLAELLTVAIGIFVTLLPSAPVMLVENLLDGKPGIMSDEKAAVVACHADRAAATLNALPRGTFLAPLDMGPKLLLNTRHGVVATGHHRAGKAMRVVIDAYSGTPEAALATIRARRLNYVALCPNVPEAGNYRKRAPHGFAAQLLDGKVPAWLQRVDLPKDAGFLIWKVVDPAK